MRNQESVNAPRATPIRRIGTPVVLQDLGERYLLAIYLSDSPPPRWRELFRAVRARVVPDPAFVTVVRDLVTFTAPGGDPEQWIAYVDAWIDETNRGLGERAAT